MRLLFIRHGDPDYEHDSLTEKGHKEARLLAETAERLQLGHCFQSPLGRAQVTASYSLRKIGKTAQTLPWLQEFPATVDVNGCPELQACFPDTPPDEDSQTLSLRVPWDMVPAYLWSHPEYTGSPQGWRSSLVAAHSHIVADYDRVMAGFDDLLAEYGYRREGFYYQPNPSSNQTLTFFCHFGITCALLSHLWNVSPFLLWHQLALAPSSVTEVVSEERQQGIASFRALRLGDQSHLALGQEAPSFACRFCETFDSPDRH